MPKVPEGKDFLETLIKELCSAGIVMTMEFANPVSLNPIQYAN